MQPFGQAFLVDANLSPRVATLLTATGYDAVAVRDLGLATAPDDDILDRALADDRVIVSHDTDFGTLLAVRRQTKPSFVLIRSSDPLSADQVADLLLVNVGTRVVRQVVVPYAPFGSTHCCVGTVTRCARSAWLRSR